MCRWFFFFGNAVVLALGEGVDWPAVVLCVAALTVVRILPITLAFLGSKLTWRVRPARVQRPAGRGRSADTALYAMTLTMLGSVLLHGGGSVVIARSLTGPPPSAAGRPGSPGTDEPDSRLVATQG